MHTLPDAETAAHVKVTLEGGPSFVMSDGRDSLLKGALRAGLGFPYDCSVGNCGSCRFELLEGEVHTLWPAAPGLSERDRRRGKRLACQSVPMGTPLSIRVRTDPACVPLQCPQRQVGTLLQVEDLTHDMRAFTFVTPGPAMFEPGQYALLQFEALGQQRAYSMSNLPNAQGEWQFVVRRVPNGVATAHLFDALQPGDTLEIDGPYGMAFLRPLARDLLCVAGGSGLAPMLSIARAAAPQLAAAGRRLHFFYGARTRADCVAPAQLATLPGYGDTLVCHEVLSQPQADDAAWTGATGFVHEVVEARLGPSLAQLEIYLAGPPPMVQASLDLFLVQRGVPHAQVHVDRFF